MESTKASLPGPLVTAMWLSIHLDEPDLVVLDTSWYLPALGRDPDEEYRRAHIKGAVRFDLDAASDRLLRERVIELDRLALRRSLRTPRHPAR